MALCIGIYVSSGSRSLKMQFPAHPQRAIHFNMPRSMTSVGQL